MGSGIAEVSAQGRRRRGRLRADRSSWPTRAATRITQSLERGVEQGQARPKRDRDAALARLTFTTDLADLSDRQLVIEAVVEDEAVKGKIFAELDELITDPDAVLASNTSSIPIMKIAAATKNPSRVLGLHFFNPGAGAAARRTDQHAGHLRRGRRRAPSSSRARCSASRWCAAATGPGSSSTRCWCPTCCRPSGWPRPASRPSRTSTRPWSPGFRIRWARCGCPISSASTRMKLIADSMYDEFKDPNLRAAAAAAADGRGRPTRQEVRPGLLRVLRLSRARAVRTRSGDYAVRS